MNEVIGTALGVVLLLIALAYLVGRLKGLFTTHAVTVSKQTEDGEAITTQVNFSLFDSPEKKKAKVWGALAIAEERMAFVQQRMQERLEEYRRLKAEEEAKEKPVKAVR